jgi:tripartite-type tricarboxylate transporter receptor subunit TctC
MHRRGWARTITWRATVQNLTGTDILRPQGNTGARNDISGQIEMMFDWLTMAQMVQSGRVKALGTTGKVRSAILPDVPTLSEAGVPGYEATMWVGVMAPAGTPQPIVDLLNSEINKILVRPDVRAAWEKQGAVPMTMKPNEFGVYIQTEIEKWAKLINANAIKPE